MDDFLKVEYEEVDETLINNVLDIMNEEEGEEGKEQTTLDEFKDQATQTYEEDFEELDEINFHDDIEKLCLEIIDGVKKGFNDMIIIFKNISFDE